MSYSYFYNPDDDVPVDGDYYMLFARVTEHAVQAFIAFTQNGDDEFDNVVAELGLTYLTHVVNDAEAAEDWAKKLARNLHPALPIELCFLEDGEVSTPGGYFLLPVATEKRTNCQSCGRDGSDLKEWRSAARIGHPLFCSQRCAEIWYVELVLTPSSTAVSGNTESAPKEEA